MESNKSKVLTASMQFLESNGPAHYKTIYSHLGSQQIDPGGSDKAYMTYAILFQDIKTYENKSKFRMLGKGVFGLAKHEGTSPDEFTPARLKQQQAAPQPKIWTIPLIDEEIGRLIQLRAELERAQATTPSIAPPTSPIVSPTPPPSIAQSIVTPPLTQENTTVPSEPRKPRPESAEERKARQRREKVEEGRRLGILS